MKQTLIDIWTTRIGIDWTAAQWMSFIGLVAFLPTYGNVWWSEILQAAVAWGLVHLADVCWNRWRWLLWVRGCTINELRGVAFDATTHRAVQRVETHVVSDLDQLQHAAEAFSQLYPEHQRVIVWRHEAGKTKTAATLRFPPGTKGFTTHA